LRCTCPHNEAWAIARVTGGSTQKCHDLLTLRADDRNGLCICLVPCSSTGARFENQNFGPHRIVQHRGDVSLLCDCPRPVGDSRFLDNGIESRWEVDMAGIFKSNNPGHPHHRHQVLMSPVVKFPCRCGCETQPESRT